MSQNETKTGDKNKTELDFSSIHYLVGDKTLLEKSFQHQLKESLE